MILVGYSHGLRASELTGRRFNQMRHTSDVAFFSRD